MEPDAACNNNDAASSRVPLSSRSIGSGVAAADIVEVGNEGFSSLATSTLQSELLLAVSLQLELEPGCGVIDECSWTATLLALQAAVNGCIVACAAKAGAEPCSAPEPMELEASAVALPAPATDEFDSGHSMAWSD